MQVHDVPGEDETEPRPVFRRGRMPPRRPLAIEDVGQELGRDALPRIDDGDHRPIAGATEAHTDAPAVGSEPDGVDEEMPHDLAEARGITGHDAHRHAELELDGQALRLRDRSRGVGGGANDAAQVHRLQIQPHAPQRNPREIEQRVDLARLQERRVIEPVEGARNHRRLTRLLAQHLDPEADRIEGVAELVGQRVGQLVVEPIGSFSGDPGNPLSLQLLTEIVRFGFGMRTHAGRR